MKLNQKDKSLILLIIATIIVLWGIFSVFSALFFRAAYHISDINKILVEKEDKQKWFNVERPLTVEDFKDRVILLDFWTYACVNCIQALPEIKKIEKEFGNKLLIIGIHSGKFDNEKDVAAIRKAIVKYDINYPVLHDPDLKIWNNFALKSWPTFIVINPHGNIEKIVVGEDNLGKIRKNIRKLASRFKYEINRDPVPLALEKNNIIGNVLTFPTKIEYAANFSYKTRKIPVLFISNSGANSIIASSLTGETVLKIGSGKEGFEDGSLGVASFSKPRGLLFDGKKLYVADSGNNALRMVDFENGMVSTLVGSGKKGKIISDSYMEAKNVDLASPNDIAFFPNKDVIAIANTGSNQILGYNIDKKTIAVLAGNGAAGMAQNTLAEPSALAPYQDRLYFLDAASSSLRVLDKNGSIKTLVGQGVNKFGNKNGDKEVALMQHPIGLMVDDTGAYIADSFNHIIRKYSFSTNKISDLIGNHKKGDALGSASATELDEPDGIAAVLNNFYIVDSNNNRVLVTNRASLKSEILDIIPPLKLPKEGFLEYLPNLQTNDRATVKDDTEINLNIDLNQGWKINELGPSFVNLLELIDDRKANLIASFDWHMVKNKKMKLPKLKAGQSYMLQGTIYYCEDKKNALCYVKSYEQEIAVDGDSKVLDVAIKLGY